MQYSCVHTPRICLAYQYHRIHCLHTFFLLTPRYPLPSHIQMRRSNSPSRARSGARGVEAGRCCTPVRARTGTGSSAVRNTTHAKRTCAANCRADAGARQAEYWVQRPRDPGASPRLAEEVCSIAVLHPVDFAVWLDVRCSKRAVACGVKTLLGLGLRDVYALNTSDGHVSRRMDQHVRWPRLRGGGFSTDACELDHEWALLIFRWGKRRERERVKAQNGRHHRGGKTPCPLEASFEMVEECPFDTVCAPLPLSCR
jgi:hypothetical protein